MFLRFFFQSSLSHTGCTIIFLINKVPLDALVVNGRCPAGAFYLYIVYKVVVHPIFMALLFSGFGQLQLVVQMPTSFC
jgi:hypothetical protein